MKLPKKVQTIKDRIKIQNKFLELSQIGYTIEEMSVNLEIHRSIISGIINKWEGFSISSEKIEKYMKEIKDTFKI